jgi:predicted neuraminidase
MSRFSKNVDDKWTKPRDIAGNKEGEEVVYWNPVLFIPDRSRPQELHVFFKKFTPIPVWVTFWTSSSDGGETWSVARELVPGPDGKGGRGPQKNPPIVLSNGDWLSVGSYEVTNPPGSEAYGVWVRPCLVFLCYLLRSFLCSLVCCRRDGSR